MLVAVTIEPLMRRAPIQETYADQWHAQRAGRFQMLGGDRSETAGEDRERIGQRVLGREVRDDEISLASVLIREPGLGGLGCVEPKVNDHLLGQLGNLRTGAQEFLDPGAT